MGWQQRIADGFARYVARASPEQRARIMRGWRRPIVVRQVFAAMPRMLDRERSRDVDATMHWEIGGRRDGGVDRRQVVISGGRARVSSKLDRDPTVSVKLDGVPFLELVSGVATGPELFMSGKLRIDGDLMLATRLASLFRMPQAGATS